MVLLSLRVSDREDQRDLRRGYHSDTAQRTPLGQPTPVAPMNEQTSTQQPQGAAINV